MKFFSTEIFKAREFSFTKLCPLFPYFMLRLNFSSQTYFFSPPPRVQIRDAHPSPPGSVCHAAPTLLSALQAAFNNANSTRLHQSSTLAFSPFPFPPLHVHPHALQPSQSLQNTPLHQSQAPPRVTKCRQITELLSDHIIIYFNTKNIRSFSESAARKVVWSVCSNFALVCFKNKLN